MGPRIVEELAYRDRKLVFKDRLHAGELLAEKVRAHKPRLETIAATRMAGSRFPTLIFVT